MYMIVYVHFAVCHYSNICCVSMMKFFFQDYILPYDKIIHYTQYNYTYKQSNVVSIHDNIITNTNRVMLYIHDIIMISNLTVDRCTCLSLLKKLLLPWPVSLSPPSPSPLSFLPPPSRCRP